jgi:hypothetical protein
MRDIYKYARVRAMTPIFKSARTLSHLYPDQFDVPAQDRLDTVGPGSGVKVCAVDPMSANQLETDGERFWVLVTERNGDRLVGRVENHLLATNEHGVSYGDRVEFSLEHIYEVYEGRTE